MSTRVYLGNGSPAYTPTARQGAWSASAATSIGPLGAKLGASSSVSTGSITSGTFIMQRRQVSAAALGAGSTSGATLDWCAGQSRPLGITSNVHLYVWVTTGSSDTVRGVLLGDTDGAAITVAAGAGVAGTGVALSAVSVSVGDFIVIEIGFHRTTSSGQSGNTIWFGNTGGTDLTSGDTNVTTDPGWFQFNGMDFFWSAAAAALPSPRPVALYSTAAQYAANW